MYNRRNCSKKIILHILYDLIVLVEGFNHCISMEYKVKTMKKKLMTVITHLEIIKIISNHSP